VCGSALPDAPASVDSTAVTRAMPAWAPAPPLRGHEAAAAWPEVLVSFAATPATQSRWSILFRIVLALPLFVWLVLLSLASGFCVIAGWFAALFTGRIPAGIQEFVTDVLRYSTEVSAYASVLVPRWPGFSLHPGYKAQVGLNIYQSTLSRWAVFFRYFLGIPAGIVQIVVSFGSYVLTIVVWLSALVLGRPAQPLYQARLLSLRYVTRYAAYMTLLTPIQPFAGFFGDHGAPLSLLTDVPDVAGETTTEVPSLTSRLHVSTWGRIFFVVSLVFGAYFCVQPRFLVAPFKNMISKAIVPPLVRGANQNVTSALDTFLADFPHCVASADPTCGNTDALTASNALTSQIRALNAVSGIVTKGRTQYLTYVADLNTINDDFVLISIYSTVKQQEVVFIDDLAPEVKVMTADYLVLNAVD
jgi:hypothetical protein